MSLDAAALTLRAHCEPRFARVVRTMVAACASLEGFSVERLSDVRLLSDELYNAVLGAGAREVVFRVTPGHGDVELTVTAQLPTGRSVDDDALRLIRLLAEVVAPGCMLSVGAGALEFAGLLSVDPA